MDQVMMYAASRFMSLPRPIWVMAIILGFIWWWPVGLAILLTRLYWRKMMRTGQWQFPSAMGGMGRMGDRMGDCMSRASRGFSFAPPSGNRAFDEYRAETLRRLEDEQREFVDYLDRLRQARDRQEFEQFMAERRQRPHPDDTPPAS